MNFDNNENSLYLEQTNNNYNLENNKNDLIVEDNKPEVFFQNNINEMSFGLSENNTGGTNDHDKLQNRDLENQHPIKAIEGLEEALKNAGSVKGVEVNNANVVDENGIAKISVPKKMSQLENDSGFLTALTTALVYYYTKTEVDNKISSLPLGTVINIKDTFEYLKKFQNNDIYNANAVNSSVDWIIQAILEAFNREVLVDINVVVNPQTFQVISNDGSLSDVVNTLDLGGTTRVICQLAGTEIRVVLQLAMVDSTYAYFTTVMKANLGAGEMKYLLGINISERYTKVIVEPLA